jgi:hypothetical protein
VFSTIEDNHIYNIALKREFYGYEIGGIKLHAAIDVVIRHNRSTTARSGTWLDWQTQGTRISRNVFYDNNRDLFVEVSHGPTWSSTTSSARGVAGAVQPGRSVRQQPDLRNAAARAGDGPGHALPPSAQHPGRRIRGDPGGDDRYSAISSSAATPGRRTAGVRTASVRRSPAPPATTDTRRRSRSTSRSSTSSRAATTGASSR